MLALQACSARLLCTAFSFFDPSKLELSARANIIVSTSRRAGESMVREAQDVARQLDAPYVPRDASLTALMDGHSVDYIYLVARTTSHATRHEVGRRQDACRLFAHPRQWPMAKGNGFENLPIARALRLPDEPPPSLIMDATAGLGGTSLRISEAFGCPVTAVEVSGPLALLLKYGMARMAREGKAWSAAASRVSAVHADATDALAAVIEGREPRPCAVYLNPCMDLRKPAKADLFLHELARLQPVSELCLHTAVAAAKRRVVLRVPHGVDPLVASHGLVPTRTITTLQQSDYLVFDK